MKKVFHELALSGLTFQMSCLGNEEWISAGEIRNDDLDDDHIRDGGFAGCPIFYKQIIAIRIFRFETLRNPNTGRGYPSSDKSEIFLLYHLHSIVVQPYMLDCPYTH